MPYYQYDEKTEISLRNNPHGLDKVELAEASKFSELLGRPENKLIDLLDLFFPPRYLKKNGRTHFYPTLPVKWRKRALEFLQRAILDGKLLINTRDNVPQMALDELLAKKTIDVNANSGAMRLWSYAVVEYDSEGGAIVDSSSLLSATTNTRAFIDFLIEHKIFPLELLNFKEVCKIFMSWNQGVLKRLPNDLKNEEGWLLIDAVSLLSGFYVMKRWVSDQYVITGFETYLSINRQPLRWGHEEQGNMTEYLGFTRGKGQIDSGKLPPEIEEMGKRWNDTLRLVQDAMRLGRIVHTGAGTFDHPNIKLDEKSFMSWVEVKGYKMSFDHGQQECPLQEKSVAKQPSRTSALHTLILERLNDLIKNSDAPVSNQSVWDSIYKQRETIQFIDNMCSWSAFNPKIIWHSEHENVQTMTKKSFQTHMSKIRANQAA